MGLLVLLDSLRHRFLHPQDLSAGLVQSLQDVNSTAIGGFTCSSEIIQTLDGVLITASASAGISGLLAQNVEDVAVGSSGSVYVTGRVVATLDDILARPVNPLLSIVVICENVMAFTNVFDQSQINVAMVESMVSTTPIGDEINSVTHVCDQLFAEVYA